MALQAHCLVDFYAPGVMSVIITLWLGAHLGCARHDWSAAGFMPIDGPCVPFLLLVFAARIFHVHAFAARMFERWVGDSVRARAPHRTSCRMHIIGPAAFG